MRKSYRRSKFGSHLMSSKVAASHYVKLIHDFSSNSWNLKPSTLERKPTMGNGHKHWAVRYGTCKVWNL